MWHSKEIGAQSMDITILGFALLVLMASCAVPPSKEIPPADSNSPSIPGDMGGTEPSVLSAELELPTKSRVGESIPLKLKVKNNSGNPVTLALGGRPSYDFSVTTEDGTEIWRWLHGQVIQAILEVRILKSGEEVVFATDWPQVNNAGDLIPPGIYWVHGIINLDPPEKLETEPKQLLITSR